MRGLRLAVLLALLGGAVVQLAAGAAWVRVPPPDQLALGLHDLHARGRVLVPGPVALGWVGVASALVLIALRGRARVALGGVVLVVGVLVAVLDVSWLLDSTVYVSVNDDSSRFKVADGQRAVGWPLLSAAGGLLLAASGAFTVVRGRGWKGLGSSYEAPGGPAEEPVTDKGVWDALDRGDDPTA